MATPERIGQEHLSEGDEDLQKNAVQFEIALLFFMLLFGQMFKHISAKTKIPYTPMITAFTLVIGFVNAYLRKNLESHDCNTFEENPHRMLKAVTVAEEGDHEGHGIIEELEEAECHYYNLAFREIEKIDPHVFLFIFLPALIFESAMNANWHIFKR